MANRTDSRIIRFFVPVNSRTIALLLKLVDEFHGSGVTQFTLLLSTGGGDTDQGLTAYNYLRAYPMEITTVNMGLVASIGSLIYCAGSNRSTMPNARFGFHPSTFNIANESLGISQLEERANQLRFEYVAVATIIADSTNLTLDRAKTLIDKRQSLNAVEARECGLANEVNDFRIPTGCKVFNIE